MAAEQMKTRRGPDPPRELQSGGVTEQVVGPGDLVMSGLGVALAPTFGMQVGTIHSGGGVSQSEGQSRPRYPEESEVPINADLSMP
jgi:hypothetical protein